MRESFRLEKKVVNAAQFTSATVKSDLESAGCKHNAKKSKWDPLQGGIWLGIFFDTIRMLFKVPEKKIAKLKSLLHPFVEAFPNLRVRQVASVASSGVMISFTKAIGPLSRLFAIHPSYFDPVLSP